jgi:site-specific recombinase
LTSPAYPALAAALEALSTRETEPVEQLVELVDALRPSVMGNLTLATARFSALCEALEKNEATRAGLQRCLLDLLKGRKQVGFFADSGILPNSGFFTELWRRLVQHVIPPIRERGYLRDCVNLIFHRRDDHVWLESISPELRIRFWSALRLADGMDQAVADEVSSEMLVACEVLATRIGAIGMEPELVRLYPRLEERDSPFLAVVAETHQLAKAYRAFLSGGPPTGEDEMQLHVLIDQCEDVVTRIRSRAAAVGTSLLLTYHLRRLDQSLRRLQLLVNMLATRHQSLQSSEVAAASAESADTGGKATLASMWMEFLDESIHGESMRREVRGLIGRTIGLLALRVTDNASRTGEHYITTTREEYFAMWRAAMGAGFIVGFMALIKIYMSKTNAAPLGYAFMYSMNYALGFMLVHVLHFTIATKQPAMTASAIAGVISEIRGRMRDVEKLATLVMDLIRSQIAAILGNVLIAMPTAMLIALLLGQIGGKPFIDADKARHLLIDISPTDSLALFHAAIAGVCLFLAGLISGYYDNLAAYERVRERIEHVVWLGRLLGEDRHKRFAAYVHDNLGGLAGNFFFGCMLGTVGTIGFMTGLPLDIRHVTFSAANFGFSMVALNFSVEPDLAGKAFAGIWLVGLVNLGVSFSLALWMALRARGVSFLQTGMLVSMLLQRLRTDWRQFFWPR